MKSYEELLAERDALAAHVEALRDAATDAANALGFLSHHLRGRVGEASLLDMAEKADAVSEALSITPQQCLAEIRAEAVSAFAKYINDTGELNFGDANFVMQEAHDYAEQLRQSKQSGTWLKDSNVNSGKRQGHCKFCLDKVYHDDDYKLVDNKLYHSKCDNPERANQGGEK